MIRIENKKDSRFESLELISWWEQERVKNAKIMVVGAGALGNEVIKNLALLGVGYVFIMDKDTIEAANLTRSILFREKDCGKPKAEVAAQMYKDIYPEGKAKALVGDLNYDIGLGVFRRMDVIICCLDNLSARYKLNQFCQSIDKPWINGGIRILDGEVSVFDSKDGACYECSFGKEEYEILNKENRWGCTQFGAETVRYGRTPTTPTISSIVAAFQVQEALKILHPHRVEDGTFMMLSNRILKINGRFNTNDSIFTSSLCRRENCPAHEKIAPLVELADCSIYNTTAGELLEIVQTRFETSDVYIYLGMNIIPFLFCKEHKDEKLEKFLPPPKILPEETKCKICHKHMNYDIVDQITKNTPSFFLERKLKDWGVPPLQILCAASSKGQTIYIEMTGDRENIFDFK